MKIEGVKAFAQPVIDGKGCRHDRPVGLVARQGAERRAVFKKNGNIADISNVDVFDDDMGIVKMEAVPEMIGVGNEGPDQQNEGKNEETRLDYLR
jgi:hypothetical protein